MKRSVSAWIWTAALAPAVMTLPAAARAGGWLAPLLALPVVIAAERLLYRPRRGGLAAAFCNVLGGGAGRVLTFIYMAWAAVLGGVQVRGSVRRVETVAAGGNCPWLLTVGLVLLAVWFARGRPAACGRWAAVVWSGLLTVLAGVAVLALLQVRRDDLLPLRSGGEELLPGTAAVLGALCLRVYGSFLRQEDGAGTEARYPAAVCVLLAFLLMTVQGVLGAELARRVEDPLLTLSRNVGLEGAFQRAESLLAATLLLADLALLTLLFWAARCGAEQIGWARHGRRAALGTAAAVLICGLWPAQEACVRAFRLRIAPWVNLALGLGVPLALVIAERIRNRKRGAHLVSGSGENGTC